MYKILFNKSSNEVYGIRWIPKGFNDAYRNSIASRFKVGINQIAIMEIISADHPKVKEGYSAEITNGGKAYSLIQSPSLIASKEHEEKIKIAETYKSLVILRLAQAEMIKDNVNTAFVDGSIATLEEKAASKI